MPPFTTLRVWSRSQDLIADVYSLSRAFPADERFALTAQVRRAALSVSSNIAESDGRFGPRDPAHFLQIALGSAREVESLLRSAARVGHITQDRVAAPLAIANEVQAMLVRLLVYRKGRPSR
jgi:four helix bundle protein